MFGLFGSFLHSIPRRLLEDEPRLSWVINQPPAGWNLSHHNISLPAPGWTWPADERDQTEGAAVLEAGAAGWAEGSEATLRSLAEAVSRVKA